MQLPKIGVAYNIILADWKNTDTRLKKTLKSHVKKKHTGIATQIMLLLHVITTRITIIIKVIHSIGCGKSYFFGDNLGTDMY